MSTPNQPQQPITSTLPREFESARPLNYLFIPLDALNPQGKPLKFQANFMAVVAAPVSTTEQTGERSPSLADVLHKSADELGCPKGTLHWIAFEYAKDKPMLQFCGSAVNCTVIDWSTLPWGCYVIATRGPLDSYKPRSNSSLVGDLGLFACALQPPFVSFPGSADFYAYSSVVLFHDRLYRRTDVFPKTK